MAYIAPHYGPRDDWRELLRGGNAAGGNNVNSWMMDIQNYFLFTEDQHLTPEQAWNQVGMSYDHASKAFSGAPPTPTNSSGLIPPLVAPYVFARSLARTVDPAYRPSFHPAHSIKVDRDATEPTFKAPRYRPRPDWRERLESMNPQEGSWQADLVRYWKMRLARTSEEEAWRTVAMTPANARLALVEDEASDDSGLIPCLPDGTETVARRVLARAGARPGDYDHRDSYAALKLEV